LSCSALCLLFWAPNGFRVGHDVGEGQAEAREQFDPQSVTERDAVATLEFGLIVGEVVHRLQNEDFEHEECIKRRPTGVRLAFFLADFVEGLAKNFPIDERVELGQKVVDGVNFVKLIFEIEKRILPGFAHDRIVKTGEKDENVTETNNVTPDAKMSRTTHNGSMEKMRNFERCPKVIIPGNRSRKAVHKLIFYFFLKRFGSKKRGGQLGHEGHFCPDFTDDQVRFRLTAA
jgi:hypothetical protein